MKTTTLARACRAAVASCALTWLAACGGGEEALDALSASADLEQPALARVGTGTGTGTGTGSSAPAPVAAAPSPAPAVSTAPPAAATPGPITAPAGPSAVMPPAPAPATAPLPAVPAEGVVTAQAMASAPYLPRTAEAWAAMEKTVGVPHEVRPLNVPSSYDWAHQGVMQMGNQVPAGWKATTGWGHVFNAVDAATVPDQAIEMRDHQTYLCTVVDGAVRWTLAQHGGVEGAAFRADFVANTSIPATHVKNPDGSTRVSFERGRAYHFWPTGGRASLPDRPLCGMLVLVQARAVSLDGQALPAGTRSALVLGLGADYWSTRTAAWDNFKTNGGVVVGWLRRVTPEWQWFGASTAGAAELKRLRTFGVVNQ